ncbi:LuxR C-terminal-related transcriptional regulator [Nocardioides sp. GXQ0305]|uniref:LuxR C-terminal-related transcriptional regulator n=1 Tax=Nocardioides sp. GXQ0305 TaxID=3423912 RepID=UPI003D7E1EB0
MLKPCLGREEVQRHLAAALTRSRWVTVVGPPGCGKTLLVGHAVEPEPAVWVDARALHSLDELLTASLDALDTETAPGDVCDVSLARELDGSAAVLVLDGLDLDTPGVGPGLQRLLESTAHSRLVATSVTTAGQPDERVVRVGPLPLPRPVGPPTGPLVELFLARLEAAGGPPVDLDEHGREVHRLLHATGGLPLLVEQAAAQAAVVGLANATPSSSLAEAVRASYDLLDDSQRRCFRTVASMPCPVGIDVVGHLVGTTRDRAGGLVTALARRSLVEVWSDGRVDLLSPVRDAALGLAGDDDHAAALGGLLRWADRVAPDHDNFGAADEPWLTDLPAMRHAVLTACASPDTRDLGYQLANRIFSSLYTSMRTRDAVEILEAVVTSGDGPPAIGAQVARRAGIAASESRGTYEGLWLLERADQQAQTASRPDEQLAKNASIRAEMHLDAGDLRQAEQEALRAVELDPGGSIIRQVTRTLADVYVSSGRLEEAGVTAREAVPTSDVNDERWITLAARTLLARVAVEQGRTAEARAAARAVVVEAQSLAEDRIGLLAGTLLRDLDPSFVQSDVPRETLPWAVRLPVLAQDARDLLRAGDVRHAARMAADLVALADGAGLGRDAVAARLLLGRALLAAGDSEQAASTFMGALHDADQMPMPLRVADALDGLASVAQADGRREARALSAAAAAIRQPRRAVAWGYAARHPVDPARAVPDGWLRDGDLTKEGHEAVEAVFSSTADTPSRFDVLTSAERQVADRVADGLTSRQVGEELFISPRTVDAHLSHIYRKLGISTRARLAAMVVDER